jgi:hypothetical protein
MKGIELPINILIIVAVAIIVLIAVVAMFYPAWRNASGTVSSDVAKSAACQLLVERGCGRTSTVNTKDITINNFDADKDGVYGTDAGNVWTFPGTGGSGCANIVAGAPERDNLAALCQCYYSVNSETACKTLCGC